MGCRDSGVLAGGRGSRDWLAESRLLVWLDLSTEKFPPFLQSIFSILSFKAASETSKLRRLISLVFAGWLPQFMIRSGLPLTINGRRNLRTRFSGMRWCMIRSGRKYSIIRALRSIREELSACPL